MKVGMRNFLMASIGVVGTTCGGERVIMVGSQILNDLIKKSGHNFKNIEIYRNWIPFKVCLQGPHLQPPQHPAQIAK